MSSVSPRNVIVAPSWRMQRASGNSEGLANRLVHRRRPWMTSCQDVESYASRTTGLCGIVGGINSFQTSARHGSYPSGKARARQHALASNQSDQRGGLKGTVMERRSLQESLEKKFLWLAWLIHRWALSPRGGAPPNQEFSDFFALIFSTEIIACLRASNRPSGT